MVQPTPAIQSILQTAAGLRQRGDAAGERDLLDRMLSTHADSPHLHNARGMRALADNAPDRAVACFRAAALLDPAEPALQLNLATAYRALRDDTGEQASLQAALDIDQRQFVPQLRMAELLQRKGALSQAALHWSAVIQLGEHADPCPPAVAEAVARGRAFLADHNRLYERSINEALGNAIGAGDEDRRTRACIDHMLGRRPIYRNECAGVYFPFLPADEFFERRHFPWLDALEARTDAIRAEALRLVEQGVDAIRPYVRQEPGTPGNKWTPLDRSLDWGACFLWEYGTRNDAVCDMCPETAAALEAVPQTLVPGKAPNAFFSILQPHTRIPPHTGVTNTRAIIHLPLVVPDGCGFRVGGETRQWQVGRAFAFDDTIEHEAWNDSDDIRIVLIFDVWNPHLTAAEQANLVKIFEVADRGLTSAA